MPSEIIISAAAELLACPRCKKELSWDGEAFACNGCDSRFMASERGPFDFLASPAPPDSSVDIVGEEDELPRYRIEHFYLPFLKDLCVRLGKKPAEVRVLDNGCGAGGSVEALRANGYDCWGIDIGSRHEYWSGLSCSESLFMADGCALPFRDSSFDMVFSFGVIEHIGLDDDHAVSMKTAPGYHEKRQAFVSESVRVLRPGGVLVLAHPNGAFPVDFWHGGWKSFRPHIPYEGFLPSYRDITRYCRNIDPRLQLSTISPRDHLSFERISEFWYGRIFRGAMFSLFTLMEKKPFEQLSGSFMNPLLVTLIRRPA